ncbi:MAG: hypothetical protein AAFV45_11985 [Pseudomonadota bacterium]
MRPHHIDRLFPAQQPVQLPIQLDQRPSRASAVLFIALLVPAIVIMMIPVFTIAATAYADPATRDVLASKPWVAAQISIGLILWLSLWVIPLRGFWIRLTRGRRIEIATCGTVQVTEISPLRRRVWTAHVADFAGLSHTVRSSLSGTRHELSLQQDNPNRTLLLQIAPTITDMETITLAKLLNCRVLNTSIVRQPQLAHTAPPVLHEPQAAAA